MHFIRELIHDCVFEVLFCTIDNQVANIFTKSLTKEKFFNFHFYKFRKLSLRRDGL
jgi:hypothetical protein